MKYSPDTIAAQSSAHGMGGIHVIRISGESALELCDEYFRGKERLVNIADRYAQYGQIYDKDELVDEVLVTVFRAPGSYTGENVVEISCHGSQYICQRILQLLLQKARLAEPGEFTQRAYINGKLDLTQAEAVGDLLASKTRNAHQLAIHQLEGRLHKRIQKLLRKLTDLRARLELEIDFPEEHEEEISMADLQDAVNKLVEELSDLAASGRDGLILRQGLQVCLVGAPNVGKSSIFNAILESERAIVTPVPGTTRDFLEESVSLGGFLLRIFDTAGLRESSNEVEKIGIERSKEIIRQADLIIYVTDKANFGAEEAYWEELLPAAKLIKTVNKSDELTEAEKAFYLLGEYILCSAKTENGLVELKSKLQEYVSIKPQNLREAPLSNARQIAAAEEALAEIRHVQAGIAEGVSIEFIAFDLQQVSRSLERITGEISSEDVLEEIFSNYCIGK